MAKGPWHVKVKFEDDCRRFAIGDGSDTGELHFAELRKTLEELFPVKFDVFYHDPDGDLIKITSDLEMQEMMRLETSYSSGKGILRLTLKAVKDAPEKIMVEEVKTEQESREKPEVKVEFENEAGADAWTKFGGGRRCGTSTDFRGRGFGGRRGGYRGWGGRGRGGWPGALGPNYWGMFGGPPPPVFAPPFGFPPPGMGGGWWGSYPEGEQARERPSTENEAAARERADFTPFGGDYTGQSAGRLRKMWRSMDKEIRQNLRQFMRTLGNSGELHALSECISKLWPGFTELGNSIPESLEMPAEEDVQKFVDQIRRTLASKISDENVDQLLALFHTAIQHRTVRHLIRTVSQSVESATAFVDNPDTASDVFALRPWEKAPGYDRESVPAAPLFKGDMGPRVIHLHYALTRTGYIPNGESLRGRNVRLYGDHTVDAVERFQKDSGLVESVDTVGVYDAITRQVLLNLLEAADDANNENPKSSEAVPPATAAGSSTTCDEDTALAPEPSVE